MNGIKDPQETGQPSGPSPAQPAPPAGQPVAPPPGYTAQPPPVQAQPQVRPADPRTKSPALACVLSAMPGLGQVYVGYYQRGFVHALVIASLIALLATGDLDELTPLVALFMAFFWLYNVIDAGRRATFYNQALAGAESIELPMDFPTPGIGGSLVGGLVLVAIGFILLLNTAFEVSLDWLEDWWPVAPILLGVYLLGRALQERSATGPGGGEESRGTQGE